MKLLGVLGMKSPGVIFWNKSEPSRKHYEKYRAVTKSFMKLLGVAWNKIQPLLNHLAVAWKNHPETECDVTKSLGMYLLGVLTWK